MASHLGGLSSGVLLCCVITPVLIFYSTLILFSFQEIHGITQALAEDLYNRGKHIQKDLPHEDSVCEVFPSATKSKSVPDSQHLAPLVGQKS